VEDSVTMAVQVNGKKRGIVELTKETQEDEAMEKAKAISAVANAIDGKTIHKVIYKPGRVLNIIAK